MWGFSRSKNRKLADEISNKILNRKNSIIYNKKSESLEGLDQTFLGKKIYPLIKDKSIIHDSYLCKHYKDGTPFPSQLKGNCFIGRIGTCDDQNGILPYGECPIECRPKNHTNWIYC